MFDRFTLVLHIFRCNARTREARMQLALAEIPLLRCAVLSPRTSSTRVFTICGPSASVGAAVFVVLPAALPAHPRMSVDAAGVSKFPLAFPLHTPRTLRHECSLFVFPQVLRERGL